MSDLHAPDPARRPADRPERLARAVLDGEHGAHERWLGAEHPRVWRLCFGLLADAAEADDLAQDAMLHLHDHLVNWDPERPYATWRNAVVANQCRDRLRRLDARRRAEASAGEARLASRLPGPEEAARQGEVREALAAALGGLTPREREVFVLRDLEGAATKAVAEALEITEGSVRSLLTLARRRLRKLLGERVPGLVPEGGEA